MGWVDINQQAARVLLGAAASIESGRFPATNVWEAMTEAWNDVDPPPRRGKGPRARGKAQQWLRPFVGGRGLYLWGEAVGRDEVVRDLREAAKRAAEAAGEGGDDAR